MNPTRSLVLALTALLLLEIAWEAWLAPLRPGGSWLLLKALPLAFLWPAVARGRRRACQWLVLLLPWYFAEAVVRVMSESGRHRACAGAAVVLTLACLGAGYRYFRAARIVAAARARH